jgi:hypothetical protein
MEEKFYVIYFYDGSPEDFCKMGLGYAEDVCELAENELRQSISEVDRVDVYLIPKSLRDLYGSDLDLSWLGECVVSAER